MPAGVTTEVKTYQLFINGEIGRQQFEAKPFRFTILRPKK